jgi:phosphate-selective porin OprO/OprP
MENSHRWAHRGQLATILCSVASAAVLGGTSARAADADELTLKWKDGLRIESADGKIQAKIGGRIQIDALAGNFSDHAENELGLDDGSGVIFRRARINLEASFSDYFVKAEYDFAGGNGDANFRDTYIGMRNLPWKSVVQVGHFKEPFSLEQVTSDNYTTFLERSLADNFAPARNLGLMWMGAPCDGRMTFATGGFREVDDFGDDYDDNDTWNLTSRLTGLPVANDDGSRLVHLGVSYSHKFTDEDEPYRVRARPGVQVSDRLFDTRDALDGDFETENIDLFNAEGALVFGPASLQAEWTHALIDGDAGTHSSGASSNGDLWGTYVEASVFVSPGDRRAYKREAGAFDRVKPVKPFSLSGGTGALQLAGRFDFIDLQDFPYQGGRGWTAGPAINWYPTSNLRVTANYVHGEREGDGNFNGGGMRFQIDY